MSNSTALTQTTNIVPVQGVFDPEPTFAIKYFVGPAGTPFYAPINPVVDGVAITNSTIDSTVIGGTSPAAGNFTNIAATTGQVTNAPVADTDIANKGYVDSVAQGLDVKASCVYSTTGNITLSGLGTQANGDWPSSLTAGDRILVKNQASSQFNGIYVAASGAWTRSADMNVWSEVPSAFTFIESGTTLADTGWVCTANQSGTIDVTAMPWSQFSGAGTYLAGNGLSLTGNTFAVVANGTTLNVSSSGVKISDTYPGQTSITTLGTIATGVWNGTDIAVADGGTGASDAANARANLSAAILGANNDITSMSAIIGSIATPTYIQFNTTQSPLPTPATGRMFYDSSDQFQTFTFQMNSGVQQKVGEEQYYRVKCSSAVTKGQVVMFTGTLGASGGLTAAPATGLTPDQSNYILGVATESGNTNDWIFITSFGEVKNLNTTGGAESWVQGQVLYYNPSVTGGLTKTKPNSPNAICVVAAVINVGTTNGILFVRPTFGSVLGGTDGNVQFTTLNNLDVIQYDSTGQYWKNVAASSLSVSYAATAGSAGSATTATTATNLAGGTTGALAYQTGAGATTFLNLGTSNYVLTAGASAPQYVAQSTLSVGSATTAGTATNLAGGAAAYIPYQSAAGTTTFLASAAGDAGKVLTSNGTSAPTWTTPTAYATVTDDTTTNATRYPLFANQTTGNLTTEFTSSTKLQFNPSTGIFTATGFSGSGANLTNLPAGELSGTIPSAVLGNSTVYIGTTGIVLNRASASQSLTGVSIDGSAGSATTATTATNANNVAITDNTTSVSTWYPIISANTTNNNPATTSSTKLQFVPSTGVLSATDFSGTIGNTTPNAATFTTLTATGQTSLGGDASLPALKVNATSGITRYCELSGSAAGGVTLQAQAAGGNPGFTFIARGAGVHSFSTNGTASTVQMQVSHTASAVNYVQVTGAATGAAAAISAQGSDTNIGMLFSSKGSGSLQFRTNNSAQTQFFITHTTSAVNYLSVTGAAAGSAPVMSAAGSDTNIDLALTPKGTGNVRFGTYTANMALTVQGYIEIKDSGGTVRKLAVIS